LKRTKEWWDLWYLDLAKQISTASKDPSTKVGSVIVDNNNRIVSVGYNGFPVGIEDTEERLNNREVKYKIVIHAERNSLLFARGPVENCTIYTWPFMPCSVCAGMIIQSGISRVVSFKSDNPRWEEEFKLSKELFAESGIELSLFLEK
jgi:dCMP deaminase